MRLLLALEAESGAACARNVQRLRAQIHQRLNRVLAPRRRAPAQICIHVTTCGKEYDEGMAKHLGGRDTPVIAPCMLAAPYVPASVTPAASPGQPSACLRRRQPAEQRAHGALRRLCSPGELAVVLHIAPQRILPVAPQVGWRRGRLYHRRWHLTRNSGAQSCTEKRLVRASLSAPHAQEASLAQQEVVCCSLSSPAAQSPHGGGTRGRTAAEHSGSGQRRFSADGPLLMALAT